ncbi:Calx-beta domain-containing protein [Lentisalinibacter orientalis]|uniref:Calx-beta domain-containing protein n=1 Tax=Lentisalinibacter orientalis TaxID=2992241 RepID=UPI003867D645
MFSENRLTLTDNRGRVFDFGDIDIRVQNGIQIATSVSAGKQIVLAFDGTYGYGRVSIEGSEYAINTVGKEIQLISLPDSRGHNFLEISAGTTDIEIDIARSEALLEQARERMAAARQQRQRKADPGSSSAEAQEIEETRVDVAFFYDQEFDTAPGPRFPRVIAEASVAFTNAAYAQHGLPLRLRTVYVGPLAEPTIGDPFVQFISSPSAYSEGEVYGADLIHRLFRFRPDSGLVYCGKAFLTGREGVSGIGCNLEIADVFAHEVGHNFGANHDRPNARGGTAISALNAYNFGYICGDHGTIMSYHWPRVPHYSSPLLSKDGEACGAPEGSPWPADNARVMEVMRETVANFRGEPETYGSFSLSYAGPVVIEESDIPLLEFVISRDGDLQQTISVETAIIDVDTSAGSDYVDVLERFEFGPGETEKRFQLQILDDQEYEEVTERLQVHLRYPKNATIATDPIELEILSDDPDVGEARLRPGGIILREDIGSYPVEVLRERTTDGTLTVRYRTVDVTARAGFDYEALSGELTFSPGEVSKVIDITVYDDELLQGVDADREFRFELFGDNVGSPDQKRFLIRNDDFESGRPEFAPAGTDTVSEDSRVLAVAVRRVDGSEGPLTFQYETRDGTAVGGRDFVTTAGTITWQDGDTAASIQVGLIDNERFDGDREFSIILIGEELEAPLAKTFTIKNDDPNRGLARFATSNSSVSESAGAVTIDIERIQGLADSLKVRYTTLDRTARRGEHYAALQGELIFAEGESRKSIGIVLIDNDQRDPSRRFRVQLVGQLVGQPEFIDIEIVDDELGQATAESQQVSLDNRSSSQPVVRAADADERGGGGAMGWVSLLLVLVLGLVRTIGGERFGLRLQPRSVLRIAPVLFVFSVAILLLSGNRIMASERDELCSSNLCTTHVRELELAEVLDVEISYTPNRLGADVDITGQPSFTIPKFSVPDATLVAVLSTVRLKVSGEAECSRIFSYQGLESGCGLLAGIMFGFNLGPLDTGDEDPGASIDRFGDIDKRLTGFAAGRVYTFSATGADIEQIRRAGEHNLDFWQIIGRDDTELAQISFDIRLRWAVGPAVYDNAADRLLLLAVQEDDPVPVAVDLSTFETVADITYVYRSDRYTGIVEPSFFWQYEGDGDQDKVWYMMRNLFSEEEPFSPLPGIPLTARVQNGLDEPVTVIQVVDIAPIGFSRWGSESPYVPAWDTELELQYAEGDGCAWTSITRPSSDDPFGGLQLRDKQPGDPLAFVEIPALSDRQTLCTFNYSWYWIPEFSGLTGLIAQVATKGLQGVKFFREILKAAEKYDGGDLASGIRDAVYSSGADVIDAAAIFRARADYRIDFNSENVPSTQTDTVDAVFRIEPDLGQKGRFVASLVASASASAAAGQAVAPCIAAAVDPEPVTKSLALAACIGLGLVSAESLNIARRAWNESRRPWGTLSRPQNPDGNAASVQMFTKAKIDLAALRPDLPEINSLTEDVDGWRVANLVLDLHAYFEAAEIAQANFYDAKNAGEGALVNQLAGDVASYMDEASRVLREIGERGGLGAFSFDGGPEGVDIAERLETEGLPTTWPREAFRAFGLSSEEITDFEQLLIAEYTGDDFQAIQDDEVDSRAFFFLADTLSDLTEAMLDGESPLRAPPVVVPNFVGMQDSQALAEIGQVGLTLGSVVQVPNRVHPVGYVMEQSVTAGTRVAQKAFVSLAVSSGQPIVDTPDIVGLNESDAIDELARRNLAIGNVARENSDTIAAGQVIAQDPPAGTRVEEGTAVDIRVSLGPAGAGGGGSGGSSSGGGAGGAASGGGSSGSGGSGSGGGGVTDWLMLLCLALMAFNRSSVSRYRRAS